MQELERLTKELDDVSEKLNLSLASNTALKQRCEKAKSKARLLKKQCHSFAEAVKSVQNEQDDSRIDNDRLARESVENARRIRELEIQLDRARDGTTRQTREIDQLNDTVAHLQTTAKQTAKAMDDVGKERDFLVTRIEKEERLRHEIEGRLEIVRTQESEKEKTIGQLQLRLKEALQPPEISDLLPISSWNSHELPGELKEIAGNLAFRLTSRIQVAFDAISRWFKGKIEQLKSDLENDRERFATLKRKFTKRSKEVIIQETRLSTDENARQKSFCRSVSQGQELSRPQLGQLFAVITRSLHPDHNLERSRLRVDRAHAAGAAVRNGDGVPVNCVDVGQCCCCCLLHPFARLVLVAFDSPLRSSPELDVAAGSEDLVGLPFCLQSCAEEESQSFLSRGK
jgi:chromosome segregation ATPase